MNDDFAIILGIWSEEIKLDESHIDKIYDVAFDLTQDKLMKKVETLSQHDYSRTAIGSTVTQPVYNKMVSKPSSKLASKLLAKKTGAKVAGKLSSKIASKTGAKIGAKYAAKTSSAWVPFVSGAHGETVLIVTH